MHQRYWFTLLLVLEVVFLPTLCFPRSSLTKHPFKRHKSTRIPPSILIEDTNSEHTRHNDDIFPDRNERFDLPSAKLFRTTLRALLALNNEELEAVMSGKTLKPKVTTRILPSNFLFQAGSSIYLDHLNKTLHNLINSPMTDDDLREAKQKGYLFHSLKTNSLNNDIPLKSIDRNEEDSLLPALVGISNQILDAEDSNKDSPINEIPKNTQNVPATLNSDTKIFGLKSTDININNDNIIDKFSYKVHNLIQSKRNSEIDLLNRNRRSQHYNDIEYEYYYKPHNEGTSLF